MYLDAMNFDDTIIEENQAFQQNLVKEVVFLRCYLDEDLKSEYLTIKDPMVLWNNLKE